MSGQHHNEKCMKKKSPTINMIIYDLTNEQNKNKKIVRIHRKVQCPEGECNGTQKKT
jgi:hypothetical protein